MDEQREKHQEVRRQIPRLLVAILLSIFTIYYGRNSGFNPSLKKIETGHVAFVCASEFNKLADMSFMLVVIRITITPTVVARMRRTRESSDAHLLVGSICLLISLFFSAYLRLFVVR